MKNHFKVLAVLGAVLSLAATAAAQLVYVDATDSGVINTTLAPSAGGGAWVVNGTDTVDGIWRLRTGFGQDAAGVIGAGGTIYESTGNVNSDDVPRLVTTAAVAAGTYYVYAFFWSDQSSSPWSIRAGLTDAGSPLPLFSGGGAPAGTPLPIDTTRRDGAGRILWMADLGQVTGSSISVFIEDAPGNNNTRTWYDGFGYSVNPVPEPSVFAIGGLGLLALLAVKRARRTA